MPPKIIFHGKLRPEGLEFPSCQPCNKGASLAGTAAAMVSRCFPNAKMRKEQKEVTRLLDYASRNIPGVLLEMIPSAREQEETLSKNTWSRAIGGRFIKIDGTIVLKNLEEFGERLGCALHFEGTEKISPQNCGDVVRVYFNLEFVNNPVSQQLLYCFLLKTRYGSVGSTLQNNFDTASRKLMEAARARALRFFDSPSLCWLICQRIILALKSPT